MAGEVWGMHSTCPSNLGLVFIMVLLGLVLFSSLVLLNICRAVQPDSQICLGRGILQALVQAAKKSGHDNIMGNISSSLRCGFHVTCSSILRSKAYYTQFWFAFSIYYIWLLSSWSKVRSWGSCETWDLIFQVLAWLHVKFSQQWFPTPSLNRCRVVKVVTAKWI